MRFARLFFLMWACWAWVASAAAVAVSDVRVFTTEYPPYASPSLPHDGAAVRMLRDILTPLGYRVHVDFQPWARLAREISQNRYDLVLLAWPGDLQQHRLLASSPWFVSRLGFFVRREQLRPVGPRIQDLQGQRVGVVRDYAYPAQLLRGGLRLEMANSDEQNLRKLIASRFDYAVLEHAVGRYLLGRDLIPRGEELLAWQEPAFAELPIHVGVVPGRAKASALLQALEEGLRGYKRDGSYRVLLQQHLLDGVDDPSGLRPSRQP